jgi:hypothetical protein
MPAQVLGPEVLVLILFGLARARMITAGRVR